MVYGKADVLQCAGRGGGRSFDFPGMCLASSLGSIINGIGIELELIGKIVELKLNWNGQENVSSIVNWN